MRQRWGRWRQRQLLLVVSLAALLLAGAVLYIRERREGPPARLPDPAGPRTVAAGERTDPATLFVFQTRYRGCPREYTRIEPAGTRYAGLDRGELAARFPGWQVQAFGRLEVVFVRTEPGGCPRETGWYTIGLDRGLVAIFEGRGLTGRVVRTTSIRAADLTAEERRLLERGIPVRGLHEAELLLEGLGEGGPDGGT